MIIAVDFDGTIVEHRYPGIGEEVPDAINVLKKLIADGHVLILWTYRSGEELRQAVKHCKRNGLVFHAVNNNFEDEEFDLTYSRKIYADMYIDDRNLLGLPDWNTTYKLINSMAAKCNA
jgi:hydroxymethylpyrimidine pyrophosphatase-like HAD family hydrolase